jgi:hypothetical protein
MVSTPIVRKSEISVVVGRLAPNTPTNILGKVIKKIGDNLDLNSCRCHQTTQRKLQVSQEKSPMTRKKGGIPLKEREGMCGSYCKYLTSAEQRKVIKRIMKREAILYGIKDPSQMYLNQAC